MKKIRKTKSLCDICFQEVPAETYEERGKIRIRKECPEHGRFACEHFWDDPETYHALLKIQTANPRAANISISVTNRCNLNCAICYARANENKATNFPISDLGIVKKYKGVMLTGGEPTVRKDLDKILSRLKKLGKRVVIFTNGIRLSDRNYLKQLKKAGLGAIFFQLDTLKNDGESALKGKALINQKRKAIHNIQAEGLPLYFYSLVVKENLGDLQKIIQFSLRYPTVKMISFDVLGMFGRCDEGKYVPTSEIVNRLCEIFEISKKDFIESSRFLNTVDNLGQFFSKKRRLFTKCFLKLPLVKNKNKLIPINRIFNLGKINREAEKIEKGKTKVGRVLLFFLKIFFREVLLNFFRNRNFRILLGEIIRNSKYFFRKKYSLANPFFMVDVMIVPSPGNIDEDFYRECNFYSVTPWNKTPVPACIQRVSPYSINSQTGAALSTSSFPSKFSFKVPGPVARE